MVLTPDRLLILAVAISVMAADGIRRMIRQRKEGELADRPFRIFIAVLVAGVAFTWLGYVVAWLRM